MPFSWWRATRPTMPPMRTNSPVCGRTLVPSETPLVEISSTVQGTMFPFSRVSPRDGIRLGFSLVQPRKLIGGAGLFQGRAIELDSVFSGIVPDDLTFEAAETFGVEHDRSVRKRIELAGDFRAGGRKIAERTGRFVPGCRNE